MSSSSYNQRTVNEMVSCVGVGLHSGTSVKLTLRPAPAGHGIVFVRTDLSPAVHIPARSQYVVDTSLATSLGIDGVRIGTVEHLLAALAGMGIDNARVEVDSSEIPIMDGSAAPFAEMIHKAGIRVLDEPKNFLFIKRPVTVTDGDKEASLIPGSRFKINCVIDFQHPLICDQSYEVDFSDRTFAREISRARTFGFLRDVENLKKMGLALGGSLENAIVVDDFNILNPDGLRFADEFVRHKVLDALGDLSLFGRPIVGHLTLKKSGHALNHKLVQRVLSDPNNYVVVPARTRDMERLDLGFPDLAGIFEPVAA
jgi:UDP-3-O-[3-hydroxymyristoyl] N-acetylglucosamine deacetylase